MSIASEIERIDEAKHAIKAAIEAKTETTIPEAARLEEYPALIEAIEGKAKLQAKSAVPSTEYQVIVPDDGYDGLSRVLVANAPLEEKTVTPTTSGVAVTPTGENIGLSKVNVMGDGNLTSSNIKNGTTIFGVTGNYDGDPTKLTEIYNWCDSVGAVMPADKNLTNLLETVKSISEITTFVVHFVTNTEGSIEPQEVVYGHTIPEVTCPPREGYVFKYWTLNGEPYDNNTPVTSDITLVAFWESGNPILMQRSNYIYILGTERLSSQINTAYLAEVTLSSNTAPPETYDYSYDVSFKNDGSIMAYLVKKTGSSMYNMFIIGNGQIELPPDCKQLFYGADDIHGLENLKTGNTTSMEEMFYSVGKREYDLSMWDTSLVENMKGIFRGDGSITSLNIRSWNTSKVTTMSSMFNGCQSLTSIDLSTWDTSNVTDMSYMFSNCKALEDIDISEWDVSSVTNLSGFFESCSLLESVDIDSWDVGKVVYFNNMFEKCSKLKNAPVRSWDVKSALSLGSMFKDCISLTSVPCSDWNLASAVTGYYTGTRNFIAGCTSITNFVAGHSTNNVGLYGICQNCTNLTNIDLSNYDLPAYYFDFGLLASNCTSLSVLDMRNIKIAREPDGLSTMLTNVPTSCTIYVYDEKAREIIMKKWANHNVIAVRTTEE